MRFESCATPREAQLPQKGEKVETELRHDLVFAQEFFELIRVEIRQYFVSRHKGRHVGLIGEFLHLLKRLSIFADVDLDEVLAQMLKKLFCVNAPRTPLAAVEFQFHQQRK